MRNYYENGPGPERALRPVELTPEAKVFRGMPLPLIYKMLVEHQPVAITPDINQDNAARRVGGAIAYGARGYVRDGDTTYIAALEFQPGKKPGKITAYRGTQSPENLKISGALEVDMVTGVWVRESYQDEEEKITKIGSPYLMAPDDFVKKFEPLLSKEMSLPRAA